MRSAHLAIIAAIAIGAGGCGQSTASANPTVATPTAPTALPSPPATASPTVAPPSVSSPIVGNWVRDQSCADHLAELQAAGFDDQVAWWVVGNWWGENASKAPGDECEATIAEEHSHFFTADGRFGSRDKDKFQVDGGDFVLIDPNTLVFPSHSAEFEYADDIFVDFTVVDDTLTFDVLVPAVCAGPCRMAYAWAMSAFFGPEPWQRAG